MQKIAHLILILNFMLFVPVKTFAATKLKKGTEVNIVFDKEINGSKLKKGDVITFKVASDHYMGDKLIFKANDEGRVAVLEKKDKGFILPNAGSIRLGRGYIKAINGTKVSILSKGEQYKGRSVARNPLFWASFVVWPLMFIPMSREGKIKAGTKTSVRIAKNINLNL